MIDQGELPPPQEVILSPEQKAKTDKDIATLSALTRYAEENDSILEVSGGYAVEAHLGGKMTRPHGDMDAVLWIPDPNNERVVREDMTRLLFDEPTAWAEYPNAKNREHFMEFREVAPEKSFQDSRRIELYMFDRTKARESVERVLIDSNGVEHKIRVTPLEEIVADKIRILNRTDEEKTNKRATTQTDLDDLKRIIDHPDFNKENCLQKLAGYLVYVSKDRLSEEEALEKANAMWEIAINTRISLVPSDVYSQQGSL